MGLGKHFYTLKNEGTRLSVAEERFFGLRPQKQEKVKKPKTRPSKDVKSILDGLI